MKPVAVKEKAGKDSPHLDQAEKAQAAVHAAPAALVIHEVVREEGEAELKRRSAAIAWSGIAAGLSMGFSFLCLAIIRSALPDAPWSRLVYAAGYTVGFVIVILGRQALFTESTLTAMLPFLMRRDLPTLASTLRFWAIVLGANLLGTFGFAALLFYGHIFSHEIEDSLRAVAHEMVSGPFEVTLLKAVLAGWLIALMAWLLPSARSSRIFVILFLTYVVGMAGLSHVVAGSVEATYAVMAGDASVANYMLNFLLPTLVGNIIGGVALVALLNHAPLAPELKA
jgi:formate-nitrite transporter family protein